MKMYRVHLKGRKDSLVSKVEMEYLVLVYGDKCRVEEIELPENKGSANIIGDE